MKLDSKALDMILAGLNQNMVDEGVLQYTTAGLSFERFAFDMFHYVDSTQKSEISRYVYRTLNGNDNHIFTGLKYILQHSFGVTPLTYKAIK